MEKKEIYHVISNTHWDREWYQCHEKYLVRLVELCDRLVEIMEAQPDYRFILDGQYAMIGDYIEAKPEMKERVMKLVGEKRLLSGPWYTQPLEGLVGGEGLIRNLQYGLRASEELGNAMRFSYEVDEFGHTSQLPQILAGFDIKGVIAWRGVPNHSKSYFAWQSPDGTIANMMHTNAGYGEATAMPLETEDYTETIDGMEYKREGLKNHVNRIRTLRMAVSESKHMLWLNGIDHSWAEEELFEVMKKIEELFPEIEVRQSTPEEYMEAVLADYKEKGITPDLVKGELMTTKESVLESANSLHPRQKLRHYETEDLLTRKLEPFAAAAWLCGKKYPAWAVDRAWKYVLENHAHDSLDCCSVDEVFEQVMARYGACLSLATQEMEECLRHIMASGKEGKAVWVFNPTAETVSGVREYTFDIPEGYGNYAFELRDASGKAVPMAVIAHDVVGDVRYNPRRGHPTWGKVTRVTALLELPEVPAYGWRRLEFVPVKPSGKLQNRRDFYLERRPGVMENEYLRVAINPNGTFDLTDKRNGKVYPSQLLLEDSGDAGSVYIHVEAENDHRAVYSTGAAAEICSLYDTPLGAAYEIKVTLKLPRGLSEDRKRRVADEEICTVTTKLMLYKGVKRVDMLMTVENKAKNHRLRALFPSMLENAVTSESGQAFDMVSRPIHIEVDPDLPGEQPYPTHPMQDYCSVSEKGVGLAVAARGIYEYECTDNDEHALALTILRANQFIDTDTFAITPEYFMREAQNVGMPISYQMSLIPHDGQKSTVRREAACGIMDPVLLANRDPEIKVMPDYVRPAEVLGETGEAVKLEGEDLTVTTFKKALKRDTVIVRVLNNGGEDKEGKLALSLPGVKAGEIYLTDLEEKRKEKIGEGNEIAFTIGKYQLKTFEFVI